MLVKNFLWLSITPAMPRVSSSIRSLIMASGKCFDRSRVRVKNLSRSSFEVKLSMSSKHSTSTIRPVRSPWSGIISKTTEATRSRLNAPRTHLQSNSCTRSFKFLYSSCPRFRRLASATVGRQARTDLMLQHRMWGLHFHVVGCSICWN